LNFRQSRNLAVYGNPDVDTLAKNGDTYDMRYDGGKGTCYPQLINLMPPHRRYIETHLGGGAVMRNKRLLRADSIDLDPAVVNLWRQRWPKLCNIVHGDAVDYLQSIDLDSDTVIYADPPYHPDTRRRKRVYRCDYSISDHERLLDCLSTLPCKVILSGYASPLYEQRLAGWSVHRFQARTRVDIREEFVWFNFDKPEYCTTADTWATTLENVRLYVAPRKIAEPYRPVTHAEQMSCIAGWKKSLLR